MERCSRLSQHSGKTNSKNLNSPTTQLPSMPYRPKEPVANGNSKGSEQKKTVCQKRALDDPDGTTDTLSKNKQKKRSRNPNKNFCPEQKREFGQTADLSF